MADAYELVIRFGHRFSAFVGGVPRETDEVRIPFTGGREDAEAAQREVQVFTRRVRDAGGEDYHPVVPGFTQGDGGYSQTVTGIVREGTLQVTARFQNVEADGEVIGWQCTGQEATLNGTLVTDPLKAQLLADEAGITAPPAIRWAEGH